METSEEYMGEPITQIIARARKGSVDDFEKIYSYSMPSVRAISRKHFIPGAEREDLVQEGTLGVLTAVLRYNEEKGASFKTFMELLVERRMIKAVVTAGRKKHLPLNEALSFYSPEEERGFIELDGDESLDPQVILGSYESIEHYKKIIADKLSDTEREVLFEYLKGKSYENIALALGKEVKTIDNALQRVRKKLRDSGIN